MRATLEDARVPIRADSPSVEAFYREFFGNSEVPWPSTLLVVGDGGRPQGICLTPYAYLEIVGREALGIAAGDAPLVDALAPKMNVATVWLGSEQRRTLEQGSDTQLPATAPDELPGGASVAQQTAWMAQRWRHPNEGFLLGDPELAGRWIPTAVRQRWSAVYGIPQVDVIDALADEIGQHPLVYGRQHHDSDFVRLSQLGVGFQVIDPGAPPFPVLSCLPVPWHPPDGPRAEEDEPTDGQLETWAAEGRVLVSPLFWSGMVRELQNLFPLTDILALTGLRSGLVLTTESFRFMDGTPLHLLNVPRDAGGLYPRVEPMLTDTGSGVLVAADAPPDRFADVLRSSVEDLDRLLGGTHRLPGGWWAHMDAPMLEGRTRRISTFPDPPRVRLRYQPRNRELTEPPTAEGPGRSVPTLRSLLRHTPMERYSAPLRPYESRRPGPPSIHVLDAVRDAGFSYAVTKAAYGPVPRVVTGVDGLTIFNHTAGRWDGWSPFLTVNSLRELRHAETKLLRSKQPGWLVGAFDTCLWAFTGPVWRRGCDLYALCEWMAGGGSHGELVNVTPQVVARYARLLTETGRVETIRPR